MLCDVLGNFHENIRDGWVGQIAGSLIFIGMIKLKHILKEIQKISETELERKYNLNTGYVFRSVDKNTAKEYCKGNYIPTSNLGQMVFDNEILAMAIGEDIYDELSQEEIDEMITEICPWYDGSLDSVRGGINTTSNLERALDYDDGEYILILKLKPNAQVADFGEDYVYVKSEKEIEIHSVYVSKDGVVYTPTEFLDVI